MNKFPLYRGWTVLEAIPSDASLRRYSRVTKNFRTAIFMDCSALDDPAGQVRDFARLSIWINDQGLKAPEVYEAEEGRGFALLEDLGNLSFGKAMEGGQDKMPLYRLATDVLKHLAAQKDLLPLPDYKNSFIDLGRRRVIDWYMPLALRCKNPDGIVQDYQAVWERIEESLPPCPPGFLHMDYHPWNLMFLPEEKGLKQCGLIDFQDAMKGPQPYDLANLLQDARVNVPRDIQESMIEYYTEGLNRTDRDAVAGWYRVMGIQFHCRWLGQLIKLALKAGKPQYLPQIPRLENYINAALGDPLLKPLKEFFAIHHLYFDSRGFLDLNNALDFIAHDAY